METRGQDRRGPDHHVPSMGPPPFGDGNVDTHQLRRSHSLRPSMGPPPFGDGNCQNASRWGFFSSSLQWGHRLSAMETSVDRTSSALRMALQWGHRLSAMETYSKAACIASSQGPSMGPPPFGDGNRQGQQRHWRGVRPSMGPPPFGDGNRPCPGWASCPCRPFNGATAFRRWKHDETITDYEYSSDLQWGHRLSAMETWAGLRGCWERLNTFNGATAFRRWKPPTPRTSWSS